ncbi:cytochrome o ubiquinol oxidase, subunit II domain protein, partial [Vibrio parahaemolyticus AQ3810]
QNRSGGMDNSHHHYRHSCHHHLAFYPRTRAIQTSGE